MYNKRGRPKVNDTKRPVGVVRLNMEDEATLRCLARNSNVSLYTYINRIVRDRIDEYRDYINQPVDEDPEFYVDEDGNYIEGHESSSIDIW